MKHVLIEPSSKAYSSSFDALIQYFDQHPHLGIQFHDASKLAPYDLMEYDGLWKSMGTQFRHKRDVPLIHEYLSLSTGTFPHFKNQIKKIANVKPDLRIFLNRHVKEGFHFQDDIAYCYRDMGIDELFFRSQEVRKEFDFVYIGAMTKARKTAELLRYFKYENKQRSILMIGAVPDDIHREFSQITNITFTGKIPYTEVPSYASQAKYGMNYIPDEYPFNLQTSTKLLEYLAMGLEVVTTEYAWVRTFTEETGVQLIQVDEDLSNLEERLVSSPRAGNQSDKVERFKWNEVIRNSGIEQKLQRIL